MPKFIDDRREFTVPPDPRLERALRRAVLVGLALVLLLPFARAYSAWLGWGPLWLLGMPLAAWWGLHRFRLPRWPAIPHRQRRRWRAQARRRVQAPRTGWVRAA